MRLLLDTHIAVWTVYDDTRLPSAARSAMEEAREGLWVSAVSLWEIAIKHVLPRRVDPMPMSGTQALEEFRRAGLGLLSLTPAHAVAVDALPRITTDPFDRLLIAQAKTEPMRFLTADARLTAYGELVMAV